MLLSLTGCGVKAETEQEKYYRKANESQQKAKEIGEKAANSIKNMDTSVREDQKPQKK